GLDGYRVEGTRKSRSRRCLRVNRVDIVGLDATGEVGVGFCIATDRVNTLRPAALIDRSSQAHAERLLEGWFPTFGTHEART
ncbi:MAG: hypothetical protein ACHQK9_14235, partial [Reyranellales bacterium]